MSDAPGGKRPLLILKTGSTTGRVAEHGDFEDWIAAGLGLPTDRIRVVHVAEGERPPPPSAAAAVVVTGSSSMVTDRAPWSERAAAWLADAVREETPVLGICYGHQLLAHALGGRVAANPKGREVGTIRVALEPDAAGDSLLSALPSALVVQATHVESVLSLPRGARRLGGSTLDANHAFVLGPSAWGVQFHPEFDADIMRTYLVERREVVLAEGIDAERLHREVVESEHGTRLLRRFGELARD